jgi:hypothetical protein
LRASSGGSWANLKLGEARYQCHLKILFDQYFEHIDPLADMFDISTIAEASKGKRKPLEIT